jgi:hypothetical protein
VGVGVSVGVTVGVGVIVGEGVTDGVVVGVVERSALLLTSALSVLTAHRRMGRPKIMTRISVRNGSRFIQIIDHLRVYTHSEEKCESASFGDKNIAVKTVICSHLPMV